MVGHGKNSKSFIFRTMLFLMVSKNNNLRVQKNPTLRIPKVDVPQGMLLGWVHRYVWHSQKFSCNYFPLGHINGTGALEYVGWMDPIHQQEEMAMITVIQFQNTVENGRTKYQRKRGNVACWKNLFTSPKDVNLLEMIESCIRGCVSAICFVVISTSIKSNIVPLQNLQM